MMAFRRSVWESSPSWSASKRFSRPGSSSNGGGSVPAEVIACEVCVVAKKLVKVS